MQTEQEKKAKQKAYEQLPTTKARVAKYYQENKIHILASRKTYQPTKEGREKKKEHMIVYRQRAEVKEMRKNAQRAYRQIPKCKDRERKYSQLPTVKIRNSKNRDSWRHRPEVKKIQNEKQSKYRQRPEVKARQKVINSKMRSKRKGLGHTQINPESNKPGFDGHHIDRDHVLYIPKEIHRSVAHALSRPESMDRINTIAFCWVLGVVSPS